jgi:hypothetical protein
LSPATATALAHCRRRYKHVICVSFPAHRFGSASTRSRSEGERRTVETLRQLTRSGIRTLILGPEDGLAGAWSSLSAAGRSGGELKWERKPELA